MNSEVSSPSTVVSPYRSLTSFRRTATLLGLLAILALTHPILQAAEFAWTGANGNNWLNPGNWSPNGVPGAADRATLGAGVVNIDGAVTVKDVQMLGANLRVNGPLLVLNSLQWSRGNLSGTEAVTLAEGSTSTFDAASDHEFYGLTLTNRGTILWAGGNLWLEEGTLVVNEGLIDSQLSEPRFISTSRNPASHIINRGIFRHSNEVALRILAPALNNEGKVEVLKGSLEVAVQGQSKGEFSCETGASLIFSQGHSFLDGTQFSGAGRIALINAVFYSLNGTISADKLELETATLTGTHQLRGNFVWNRGRFTGPGSTTLADGATLTIQTDGDHEFYGQTLTNRGTILWTGGNIWLEEGTLIVNEELVDCQLSQPRFISTSRLPVSHILNRGTFRKSSEPSILIPSPRLTNEGLLDLQQGVLDLATVPFEQSSGELRLSGGQLKSMATMTLNGGRLTGSGILAGSVDCNAAVSPGSNSVGGITIQGSLRLRSDARVLIQINGDQSYDRLAVTGSATLDGTLEASLLDDFYPAARSSFPWLNAATREGQFATFVFPSNDVGMRDDYLPAAAVIQVINVRPILPVLSLQSIDELSVASIVSTATDDDLPPQLLSYRLTESPEGMEIDAQGVIHWTPTEAQGPMERIVTVAVTDNGIPNLTVRKSFPLAVKEVNSAPVWSRIENQIVEPGALVRFTPTVSDSDLPANQLGFTLVSGPAGATVSGSDGQVSWKASAGLAGTTHSFKLNVADNGLPPIGVDTSFEITVKPLMPIRLTLLSKSQLQAMIRIEGNSGLDYVIQQSSDLSSWTDISTHLQAQTPLEVAISPTEEPQVYYRATLGITNF
ncbi:MAG: hypothetical protein JNN07_27715 [Verrucomicrobiales bacterium]|nr:hypothetical protein [Verrucomicrobiales bacterium]